MRPEIKDMSRLWDMLDAARTALEFTNELQFDDFMKDRKTRNAVERNLEIIGEAARRVSIATRNNTPEVPWRSIIGLRNVLIHEYGEVRHEILWNIIRKKLPPLIKKLKEMDVDNPPSMK